MRDYEHHPKKTSKNTRNVQVEGNFYASLDVVYDSEDSAIIFTYFFFVSPHEKAQNTARSQSANRKRHVIFCLFISFKMIMFQNFLFFLFAVI